MNHCTLPVAGTNTHLTHDLKIPWSTQVPAMDGTTAQGKEGAFGSPGWSNDLIWESGEWCVLDTWAAPYNEELSSLKSFWHFFWETLNTGELFMVHMGKLRLTEEKQCAHGHTIR